MKKTFFLLVGLLISIHFFGMTENVEKDSPFQSRQFPASSIKKVVAKTTGGKIEVNGDASSDVFVKVYVEREGWSQKKIKQVFDENYSLEMKVEGGTLFAIVNSKKKSINWHDAGLSISLKINVPYQTDTELNTSGGSIQISNLEGTQDFKTSGGSLSLANLSGKLVGKTSGGSIHLAGSNGSIDLTTSGGSVNAVQSGGTISLKTSGGSINLANLDGSVHAVTSGGNVSANDITGQFHTATSGGNINLSNIAGNLDASTSGGSVNVAMRSTNEYVKLKTSGGNIRLTIPDGGYRLDVKAQKISAPNLTNFNGSIKDDRINGTIGTGKTSIEIKSSNKVEISFN